MIYIYLWAKITFDKTGNTVNFDGLDLCVDEWKLYSVYAYFELKQRKSDILYK